MQSEKVLTTNTNQDKPNSEKLSILNDLLGISNNMNSIQTNSNPNGNQTSQFENINVNKDIINLNSTNNQQSYGIGNNQSNNPFELLFSDNNNSNSNNIPPNNNNNNPLPNFCIDPEFNIITNQINQQQMQNKQQDLEITIKEKEYFGSFFKQEDLDGKGFIYNHNAIDFFGKSGLQKNIILKILQLADLDKKGMFNEHEFILVMYLISMSLKGESLPDKLSEKLVLSAKNPIQPQHDLIQQQQHQHKREEIVDESNYKPPIPLERKSNSENEMIDLLRRFEQQFHLQNQYFRTMNERLQKVEMFTKKISELFEQKMELDKEELQNKNQPNLQPPSQPMMMTQPLAPPPSNYVISAPSHFYPPQFVSTPYGQQQVQYVPHSSFVQQSQQKQVIVQQPQQQQVVLQQNVNQQNYPTSKQQIPVSTSSSSVQQQIYPLSSTHPTNSQPTVQYSFPSQQLTPQQYQQLVQQQIQQQLQNQQKNQQKQLNQQNHQQLERVSETQKLQNEPKQNQKQLEKDPEVQKPKNPNLRLQQLQQQFQNQSPQLHNKSPTQTQSQSVPLSPQFQMQKEELERQREEFRKYELKKQQEQVQRQEPSKPINKDVKEEKEEEKKKNSLLSFLGVKKFNQNQNRQNQNIQNNPQYQVNQIVYPGDVQNQQNYYVQRPPNTFVQQTPHNVYNNQK